MGMVYFKKLSANLKMKNKILIIIFLLFTFQVLRDQFVLTVITSSKGNDNKSVSHVSLYKNKKLCSNKPDNIDL